MTNNTEPTVAHMEDWDALYETLHCDCGDILNPYTDGIARCVSCSNEYTLEITQINQQ